MILRGIYSTNIIHILTSLFGIVKIVFFILNIFTFDNIVDKIYETN